MPKLNVLYKNLILVHEKTYKPGSGGVASVSVDGVKDYHYKVCIIKINN